MFAGIFENDNVFADEPGCPVGFTEYPLRHNLKICMTAFNNNLIKKNVAFGGLSNCRAEIKESGKSLLTDFIYPCSGLFFIHRKANLFIVRYAA